MFEIEWFLLLQQILCACNNECAFTVHDHMFILDHLFIDVPIDK